MKSFTLFILFSLTVSLTAQNQFYKVFSTPSEDVPQKVISTADGGSIVVGYTKDNPNDWSIFILKYDINGSLIWHKKYDGNKYDLVHDIKQTTDGGFILTGRTWSFLTQGGDSYIMKIDNTGSLIFFNVFDGPNSNYYNASHSICELPNGNFISIGQYHMLNNPVRYDWEICHFDSQGNINLNKTIGFTNGDEFGKDIISIGNNEFLIGGFTQTTQWGKDMAIFHGDDTGNELNFINFNSSNNQQVTKVLQCNDGSFYIVGDEENSSSQFTDFKVIKTDQNFNILWANSYGTTSSEKCFDADIDANNNLFLIGSSNYNNTFGEEAVVLKINPNGTLLVSKSYGGLGAQAGLSIATDLIGDVLLLNEIPTFSGNTQQDVSLIKTDNNLSHSCILDSFPAITTANNYTITTGHDGTISHTNWINSTNPIPTNNLNYVEEFFNLDVDVGQDMVICNHDSILLNAVSNYPNSAILWENGYQNNTYVIPSLDTNYFNVSASYFGCIAYDTLTVYNEIDLLPSITADTTIGCPPFSVSFENTTDTSITSYASCSWSTNNQIFNYNPCNSYDFNYTFSSVGYYDVTLTLTSNNNCIYTNSFDSIIQVLPNPIAEFSYSPQQPMINDLQFNFTNNSLNATQFIWNIDQNIFTNENISFTTNLPLDFTAELIALNDIGCADTTQNIIQYYYNDYFIPNSFSPNGDGLNDYFGAIGVANQRDYNLQIYNRWGELIFESFDPNFKWDGTFHNLYCPDGVYVWKLYCVNANNQFSNKNGYVTLLR